MIGKMRGNERTNDGRLGWEEILEIRSYTSKEKGYKSQANQRTKEKKLEKAKATANKLVEPIAEKPSEIEKVREKIKVPAKSRSALIPGEGRSMDMEID